jgi:hypothetical protein
LPERFDDSLTASDVGNRRLAMTGQDVCLHHVFYIYKIPGLLVITIDHELLAL